MTTSTTATTVKKATVKKATAKKANVITEKQLIDGSEAVQKVLVSALQVRKADAVNCSTIIHDIKFFESASGLATIKACIEKGLNIDRFCATAQETNKRSSNFIALKVITKIKQTMQAVANNSISMFDGYSHSILRNLLTVESIDTHNILRCLSSKIESDIEDRQAVTAFINSGVTTASTQSSSSRQMFEVLDICQVIKGKKLDSISFKQSASGQLIKSMFEAKYA